MSQINIFSAKWRYINICHAADAISKLQADLLHHLQIDQL